MAALEIRQVRQHIIIKKSAKAQAIQEMRLIQLLCLEEYGVPLLASLDLKNNTSKIYLHDRRLGLFNNRTSSIIHPVLSYRPVNNTIADFNRCLHADGKPFFGVVGFAACADKRHFQPLLV